MKTGSVIIALTALLVSSAAFALDSAELGRKADAERDEAISRAARAEEKIFAEREELEAEIKALEAEKSSLEGSVIELERRLSASETQHRELAARCDSLGTQFKGIPGVVTPVARDLDNLMRHSALTAFDPGRLAQIEPLLRAGYFPGPRDISTLANLFLEEIAFSAEARVRDAAYVDREGLDRKGRILTLGKFTTLYEHGEETGFLLYEAEKSRLVALSSPPSRSARKQIRGYFSGLGDAVPIDLSSGRALARDAAEELSTIHTRKGGAVILLLLVSGLATVIVKLREKKSSHALHGGACGVAATGPEAGRQSGARQERQRWGAWALARQRFAHRTAMVVIFLCGIGAYVWGGTLVPDDSSAPIEVNLVSLVSLAPPPIAGYQRAQRMQSVDQLRQYVPSATATKEQVKEADFEPDLVTPSLAVGMAGLPTGADIAFDLAGLADEDVQSGNDFVFESYELDQPPQPVVKVPPPYPFGARERGVEGAVQVRMLVQPDGSVGQVLIVDARPKGLFEDAVMKSLSQWRFSPGKIEGKTVTAWVVTTIHFDLN